MLRQLCRSFSGFFSLFMISVFVFCAIFADFISPYNPTEMDLSKKIIPPMWMDKGSMAHPLGTDQLGRDLLSRIIHGSRVSILIASCGTVLASGTGVVMGCIAGFYKKFADACIGRIMDINLAFPFILLAIFVVAILGPGLEKIILVAGITGWVRFARVVRGEILAVKELEYIEAIRSLGGTNLRIIVRHILPNIVSPIIVIATLELAKVILMESSLSYLGMGVPPQVPTWGRMLAESSQYMQTASYLAILPGLIICLLVLSINLFGDWLRDYIDPKLDTNERG